MATLTDFLTKLNEATMAKKVLWARVGLENRFTAQLGRDQVEISGDRTPAALQQHLEAGPFGIFLSWVWAYITLPVTAVAAVALPKGQSAVPWPHRKVIITSCDTRAIVTFEIDREHPSYCVASSLLQQAYTLAEVGHASVAIDRMHIELEKMLAPPFENQAM